MSSTRGWTLVAAAAMSLGAVGLAPAVVRYWSAQFGAAAERRHTTTRALKAAPAPIVVGPGHAHRPSPAEANADRSPQDAPVTRREPAPLAREPEPDEAEPELEDDAVAELASALTPPESVPSPPPHPTPAHGLDPEAVAVPEPFDESPPEAEAESEAEPEPAPIRRVSLTVLEARTQPGLCKGSVDALDARDALMARFHTFSWDGASQLYLDPRLAPGTERRLIADLAQAESELSRVLQLAPLRPDVFAYYDTQLLLAAGCTNENVAAYYDGALHVVPSHDDVATSILHEYTHHALTQAGLLGPAWAQEGIAMHMAGETWWRGDWMARVLERPFSLEVMESAVPYTLRSDQAGLFYAQSAAMVACAVRGDPRGLHGLVESLAAGNDRGELSYQLPSGAAPLAWRRCFSDLAR